MNKSYGRQSYRHWLLTIEQQPFTENFNPGGAGCLPLFLDHRQAPQDRHTHLGWAAEEVAPWLSCKRSIVSQSVGFIRYAVGVALPTVRTSATALRVVVSTSVSHACDWVLAVFARPARFGVLPSPLST